jgi:hypothetical protein
MNLNVTEPKGAQAEATAPRTSANPPCARDEAFAADLAEWYDDKLNREAGEAEDRS